MARLNTDPPVSTDSLETLRRKLLRQNRDLAKSNNIRALRIRELENECSLMLSENLELRGRILELETQVEDNEARRIADHALSIKEKLEAQLTEWGTMLAGLGLEPPPKRHSPRARKSIIKQRMSFHSNRPSPSQRRLRDIAREVEELGHISENKSYPRKSMNPEQILALRSEADEVSSPELGPRPVSKFIDQDPVKIDSPTRTPEPSPPRSKMQPPIMLQSLRVDKPKEKIASPEKKEAANAKSAEPESPVPRIPQDLRPVATPVVQPIKTGSKRKFAARDENDVPQIQITSKENRSARILPEKASVLGKAEGKTLKELTTIRKEARDRATVGANPRKPLSAKSTNDDVSSPKKVKDVTKDEIAAAKADAKPKTETKPKATHDRPKARPKPAPVKIGAVLAAESVMEKPCVTELAAPVAEPALLLPTSPEPATSSEEPRGDTPPPAHISSSGETSRPSRRNRTAVSYAEPNLRDKMRRPSKQLFDAVAGEAYTRRTSQSQLKRESDVGDLSTASMSSRAQAFEADLGLGSPLASRSKSIAQERQARQLSTEGSISKNTTDGPSKSSEPATKDESSSFDSDVYDFNDSSPQVDKSSAPELAKPSRRQSKASRRHSEAVDTDEAYIPKERTSSRRRSMMV
ncbi:hypothetical protein NLU13_6187 [Sarocladium strictum]|uniref:Shugoshin n=1 Tax=Sarocladium strictum TaxID=5046 RepID=A0AA39GFF2_SARSR|nr:hypothetical protein NLU13_6187 [Sarocladium strictum]